MEKAKLKNKAITNLIEDVVEASKETSKETKPTNGYSYKGKIYKSLRELDMPLSQAEDRLADGIIEKV